MEEEYYQIVISIPDNTPDIFYIPISSVSEQLLKWLIDNNDEEYYNPPFLPCGYLGNLEGTLHLTFENGSYMTPRINVTRTFMFEP